MNYWLTDKDIEELGLAEEKWYHLQIEYDPPLGLIIVDNEIVACFLKE